MTTLLEHQSKINERGREFVFTDDDFQWIRATVKDRVGINLTSAKRDMVYNRLTKILRRRRLATVGEYLAILDRDDDTLMEFLNAITTNVTHFFREGHHFERLAREALPEIVARNRTSRKLRLWSAGCSSGEEPYSIAITLEESLPAAARGWDVLILATDLDTSVLQTAQQGVYSARRVEGVDEKRRAKWFQRGQGSHDEEVRVRPALRDRIRFRQLNLMESWPMRQRFDVIFCRNVVIYFDKDTQRRLFDRFADQLEVGGWLFIGHSESLHGVSDRFEFLGQSTYRKVV